MKDGNCKAFQEAVDNYLIRHRSILDVLSKFQESSARVNRAVAKAVTACGCLTINACRQPTSATMSLAEFRQHVDNHLRGELCESCREVLYNELGASLFYLAALCSLLGLDLDEVLAQEANRLNTLGIFNLS
ncbi:MAG TPA: DUF1573 domain-containing protein [Firmicutes bacterium]|nr:DUF1573 domain-containing protein [Bacillota bacterium]